MRTPTPTDNIFMRYAAGLTTTVAVLLVLTQVARAWAFSQPPVERAQAGGSLELALAYLLILPAIWRGEKGIVAIMFAYVGLLGITQLLVPESAVLLGCFAAATQVILALITVLKSRKPTPYQYEK